MRGEEKRRNKIKGRRRRFKTNFTCVTGDVSGIDKSVAEKPYLNRGFLSVTVGILTIDGNAAPSSTYASFNDDAPHPPD